MKYLLLPLLLSLSCASDRSPSSVEAYQDVSFTSPELQREFFRKTYPHLSDDLFDLKWANSTQRPLLFFRSYVNSFYAETMLRGALKTPVFCYGDPHPENFGFISFNQTPLYLVNDLDDSGVCPIGLDILRYFSALRLTINDEEKMRSLAGVFQQTVEGMALRNFDFQKPDLIATNEENLLKYTKDDQFLTHKNITLLEATEKERLIAQLIGQMNGLNILDIASYHKNDGGSAGLKRYWLIVMGKEGDRELIEFKQTTSPGVGQSGLKQDFSVTQTPLLIWGKLPDFYGFVSLDQEIYMTRTRADGYIDLGKLGPKRQMDLLSYQVQLLALFHQKNLQKLGGVQSEWILEGSRIIALRYLDAFNRYKR